MINIASGSPIAIKQVVHKIVDMVGCGQPQFGQIKYRSGENMALYADIFKANSILGWKPNIDINDGLQETFISLQKNSR